MTSYADNGGGEHPAGRALVAAEASGDDTLDAAVRPRTLEELIGQARVRDQLGLVLEAARSRGRPPDHVLLAGPPGLGKTTLAMIIATELGAPLRITSGPRSRLPATSPPSCPRWPRATCSSSTRSTG